MLDMLPCRIEASVKIDRFARRICHWQLGSCFSRQSNGNLKANDSPCRNTKPTQSYTRSIMGSPASVAVPLVVQYHLLGSTAWGDGAMQGLKMSVLRQIEVVGNQRSRQSSNQDSTERIRTHSLNEEALRRYLQCIWHARLSLIVETIVSFEVFVVNVPSFWSAFSTLFLLHVAINDGSKISSVWLFLFIQHAPF